MPGDYSRKLFDAKKHYSAVLEQQGRVQLDADWNEQVDIQQYRISTETIDVIGAAGVPKDSNGFEIIPFVDGSDFTILPGRIYVDGLLFELEPGTTTYLNQPYYPNPDTSDFFSPASPPSPLTSPLNASLKDGTYIIYLEGWQKEINFYDDATIQEVALGEADTTTRLQNVWQVKLVKVTDNATSTCNTSFAEWDEIKTMPSGKLSAQAITNAAEVKPCVLPPGSGYTGLENQLYRIQILKTGDRSTATFIWSRDNASVETKIINTTSDSVTVTSIGKDDVLGFANGQWVEVLKDEQNLAGNALLQIDTIDPALLKITFKNIDATNSLPAYDDGSVFKLRRWDVSGTDMKSGIAMTDDWINLESGIQVKFDAGNYKAGDYWLIPARTATSNIEWNFTTSQSPSGIKRHFNKLGLIVAQNAQLSFTDCRPKFPTLTGICAEDICFNNTNCSLPEATTVQEALDMLCQRSGGGSCTIVVSPGKGWENALNVLADGMDAQVCFQVGDYPLDKPVILKNKGNLKFVGCGRATRIISSAAEAALVFDHCKTITVRDLYAEGGITGANQYSLTARLNGVFNFISCSSVNIDHVSAKSGFSDMRNCTCITVNNDVALPGSVRIEDCDFQIAGNQQGILIINTSECWIIRNSLKVYSTTAGGFTYQPGLRYLLASNLQAGAIGTLPNTAGNNVTIISGNFTVNFKSDQSLKDVWLSAMKILYPTAPTSITALQFRIKDLAKKLIIDQNLQNQFTNFGIFLKGVSAAIKPVGAQGITVGGQVAKNVYIEDNVMSDLLQGIHVGVSHRSITTQADVITNLSIRTNSIAIALPVTVGLQDRYGIFVGNCNNLLIENNKLTLERLTDSKGIIAIDGIRVWGSRGPRLIITQNLLTSIDSIPQNSFSIGINVQPFSIKPATALWMAMYNVVHAKVLGISTTIGNQNNVVAFSN